MTTPYLFTYPVAAAGLEVTVKNASGSTVATETLGSQPNASNLLELLVTGLDSGNYVGTVSLSTAGMPNANAALWRIYPDRIECTGLSRLSLDQPGGGGAVEYAKFIGRATGDTSGDEFPLVFEVDGTPVDWASVNEDDNIAIPGPVSVNMYYRYIGELDFTSATGFTTDYSPDSDVTIRVSRDPGDGFGVNAGGPYAAIPVGTSGAAFELDAVEEGITQSERASANTAMEIKGTVNANGYNADHEQVSDGVVTAAVAVWISRTVLPDAPTLT